MTVFKGVGASGGTPKGLIGQAITTDGYYSTLQSPAGTDYQVTVGKTFKITRVFVNRQSNSHFEIGYGDTAVSDSASAPTNAIRVLGGGADYSESPFFGNDYIASSYFDVYAEVPAGKYPYIRSQGTTPPIGIFVIGIEE